MPAEAHRLVDAFAEANVPCHLDFQSPMGGYVRLLTAAASHDQALEIIQNVLGASAPIRRSHRQLGSVEHPGEEGGNPGDLVMEVDGSQRVSSPSHEDLQLALEGLNAIEGGGFIILGRSEFTYLQLSGNQDFGYTLEYQEESVENHHREASGGLTQEQVLGILEQYRVGDEGWKAACQWEKMEM